MRWIEIDLITDESRAQRSKWYAGPLRIFLDYRSRWTTTHLRSAPTNLTTRAILRVRLKPFMEAFVKTIVLCKRLSGHWDCWLEIRNCGALCWCIFFVFATDSADEKTSRLIKSLHEHSQHQNLKVKIDLWENFQFYSIKLTMITYICWETVWCVATMELRRTRAHIYTCVWVIPRYKALTF